jgi:signal peptidase I
MTLAPEVMTEAPDRPTESRLRRSLEAMALRQAAFLVICALSLSLFGKSLVVQFYTVPSASMEPTLMVGDMIAVTRPLTSLDPPHRGDIVVFRDPGSWLPPTRESDSPLTRALRFIGMTPYHPGQYLVKRVVGEAGDVLECRGNSPLYLNGRAVTEPYIARGSRPCAAYFTVTVPARALWVLGDNRDDSADSRFHLADGSQGSVPLSLVVGKAVARVWPANRWGAPE